MEYNKLIDYDYNLPPELIAQEPLLQRDKSKMLVIKRSTKSREHTIFDQLPDYLEAGDVLVLNNTKVIPARLIGTIAGKSTAVELLLLNRLPDGHWIAMAKPGRKLKPGQKIMLGREVEANIIDYAEKGLRVVDFKGPKPFEELLPALGKVPLPPYIKKPVKDPELYQTIYALENGSAAAPTAGFHFTEEVFRVLKDKGIKIQFITLHIGPGTFQPVKTEDIRDHLMHEEYFCFSEEAAGQLNTAREKGNKIVAVGTTACRVLETVIKEKGTFAPMEGWTGLYIYPGFQFRAVDALLTNFHLPRSSLLMLVSALAGHELIMAAYREAVTRRYRFYSFGDCMLIL
jgi:S-adenosylmethionine:tRNA ribosyltransferase-isomerase